MSAYAEFSGRWAGIFLKTGWRCQTITPLQAGSSPLFSLPLLARMPNREASMRQARPPRASFLVVLGSARCDTRPLDRPGCGCAVGLHDPRPVRCCCTGPTLRPILLFLSARTPPPSSSCRGDEGFRGCSLQTSSCAPQRSNGRVAGHGRREARRHRVQAPPPPAGIRRSGF